MHNLNPSLGHASVDTEVIGSAVPTYSIGFYANPGYYISNIARVNTSTRISGFVYGQTVETYTVSNTGSNLNVYVQFAANRNVTYSAGLGSGSVPTEQTHPYGDTFTVASASGLSRSGFSFAGWSDGTNTYQPGDSYTVASFDVTLKEATV